MSRINSLLENILGFALVWYPSSYTVSKAILRQVGGGVPKVHLVHGTIWAKLTGNKWTIQSFYHIWRMSHLEDINNNLDIEQRLHVCASLHTQICTYFLLDVLAFSTLTWCWMRMNTSYRTLQENRSAGICHQVRLSLYSFASYANCKYWLKEEGGKKPLAARWMKDWWDESELWKWLTGNAECRFIILVWNNV